MNLDRLHAAYLKARDTLLAERTPEGFWVGELSSSALSTATAVGALAVVRSAGLPSRGFDGLIDGGVRWLVEHQNADGGWGDTVKSVSNISTTMLCRAAFHLTGTATQHADVLKRCDEWLAQRYGRTPAELAEAVRQRYGKDRTFAVPILTMCALAGLVEWREVTRLPFELACLPQSWYRFARMPVVSYALPALIAIGQCVHHHRGTWNPLTRLARWLGKRRSLKVLERIQPSSGGYLEATPLTSFVVMSLASFSRDAAAGRVIEKGVEFIVNSARPDGSWPIDSNLSVWVTTLSVNALGAAGDLEAIGRREELLSWLLAQQCQERHPYTGADPGGWGWSHLPGSVPDCDDTPGALLAVHHLLGDRADDLLPTFAREAVGPVTFVTDLNAECRGPVPRLGRDKPGFPVALGLFWLELLRNRDGGWPTFCRGWGTLPFDRSGCDLTAHALRVWAAWASQSVAARVADIMGRAAGMWFRFPSRPSLDRRLALPLDYLRREQRPDGSWLPLWFGNQHAPDDINPVYGTARVLAAYRDLQMLDAPEAQRGVRSLLDVQNADGGWGGAKGTPSSVEETALAVEVLMAWVGITPLTPVPLPPKRGERGVDGPSRLDEGEGAGKGEPLSPASGERGRGEGVRLAVERGLEYLVRRVEDGTFTEASPIGFYFAKLWYFEKLYPIIFTVAALGRALRSGLGQGEGADGG